MNYKKGVRMLTLSWSDGDTLIPVNSCLLASSKETNIIGPINSFDRRTLAGKRRKLAQTKAPQAMMTLLDTAMLSGLSADYVLFDSWFSNPAQIAEIKKKGMDVIAMIKKSSRIKYTYNSEHLVDEMTNITFCRLLGILMDALMASLQEILKLSDKQLTTFAADFEARLPEYLRNALYPMAVAA